MRSLLFFIFRSIAFLCLAAVVYAVGIFISGTMVHPALVRNLVYPKGGYGHMWSRLKEVEDHGPVDIVVLGSSIAYRDFDPRQFAAAGYSMFNLGSSSQSFLQTEVLVDRYMDRLDPKLTIIEVTPSVFQTDGVESSLDLLANGGVDLDMIEMAWQVGNIKTFNALVYSGERQVLDLDRDFKEAALDIEGKNRYVPGGFVEHTSGHFIPKGTPAKRGTEPSPDQLAALEGILAKLKDDGRKYVLIQAPLSPWQYASYTDPEAHAARMCALGTYINMNGIAGLEDSSGFYDKSHMNQFGVTLFHAALLDSLEHHGLLPPPSGK